MFVPTKAKKCYLCGAKENLKVFPNLYVKNAYICKKGCSKDRTEFIHQKAPLAK